MRPNPQETANLATFTGEILNGKLHFLCSASWITVNGFKLHIFSAEYFCYYCNAFWHALLLLLFNGSNCFNSLTFS